MCVLCIEYGYPKTPTPNFMKWPILPSHACYRVALSASHNESDWVLQYIIFRWEEDKKGERGPGMPLGKLWMESSRSGSCYGVPGARLT